MAFPHRPVLFLSASNGASRNALSLGIGPCNSFYDISMVAKADKSSKLAGIFEPDTIL